MIYVTTCPKCHNTISFLNDEDMKLCKNCGEVVVNTNKNVKRPLKNKKSYLNKY